MSYIFLNNSNINSVGVESRTWSAREHICNTSQLLGPGLGQMAESPKGIELLPEQEDRERIE